jgi:sarcosine oxidase subunit beta
MRVIVIGGGIIGLSSAYALLKEGVDVTIVEKNNIGGGMTERSNGGIRSQFSTPINIELSKRSLEVWDSFEKEFGVDIDFRKNGYLILTRDEDKAENFKKNIKFQNEHGVDSLFLSPKEATRYCPELRTENVIAAAYSAEDGVGDPEETVALHVGDIQSTEIAAATTVRPPRFEV